MPLKKEEKLKKERKEGNLIDLYRSTSLVSSSCVIDQKPAK